MAETPGTRRALSERETEQAILSLKKGAYLLKCGRRGKPKFCLFRLSTDEKTLIWHSRGKEKQLKLKLVKKIVLGQKTVNFQRYPLAEKESQAFSLIYQNGERSLDLICKDKEQAQSWFIGLNTLILFAGNISSAKLRGNGRSHSSVNSPVSRSRRKCSLAGLEDSARFSQVNSLCGSPPQSLLQRHYSISFSNSFRGSQSSTPRPPSDGQIFLEYRAPLLHTAYNGFTDKLNSNHLGKLFSKEAPMKFGSSLRRISRTNISDGLKDVFMWGEGVDGSILGGGSVPDSSLKRSDVLLPKLLECTGILDVRGISCGRNHAAIVTKHGEVYCWGEGDGGRLGHKANVDVSIPKIVESLVNISIEDVACGVHHTCALTSLGEIYAWGNYGHGNGFFDEERNRSQWLPHKLSFPSEGIFISKITCGERHMAVVTASGQLFTFGDGLFGVLGHGNLKSVCKPKEVEALKGLRVMSVACGPWHTAAIVDIIGGRSQGQSNSYGGKLFTWGDHDKGKLGHGDHKRKFLPTCVAPLVDCDFVQVSCGNMLTVALSVTGIVYTMGSSENGQLGNPQAEDHSITPVEGRLKDKHVKQISSGSSHVVVLTTKGEVYSWGKGANGRLGLGDSEDRNSPSLVESLKDRLVESIACGTSFAAAICMHKMDLNYNQSVCSCCKVSFSFTRKRHNCYHCGFAFCNACSNKRAMNASLAPNRNKSYRVCDTCYLKLNNVGSVSAKLGNQTPREMSVSQAVFSNMKTNGEEETLKQLYACCSDAHLKNKSLERQVSLKHGGIGEYQEMENAYTRVQRWGKVPCPSQFSSCSTEYPIKNSMVSNSCSTDLQQSPHMSRSMRSTTVRMTPYFAETDRRLSEEVQLLKNEIQRLIKQCHVKNEKLQLYKQRVEETWCVAREEAAKCKAAKDIIKVLTAQMNAKAGKFSAGKELNNLKSILCEKLDLRSPQIRPIQTEFLEPGNTEKFLNRSCQSLSEQNMNTQNVNHMPNRDNLAPSCPDSQVTRPNAGTHIQDGMKEWVEQDEPGVYLTFISVPDGRKGLKRVRFSRKHFNEKEAKKWWEDNQRRVYHRHKLDASISSWTNKKSF